MGNPNVEFLLYLSIFLMAASLILVRIDRARQKRFNADMKRIASDIHRELCEQRKAALHEEG